MHCFVIALSLLTGQLSNPDQRSARLVDAGDFVFAGSSLVHQNDELAALERERLDLEESNRPIVVPIVLLGAGVTSYIVGSIVLAVTTSLGPALVGVVLVLAATALVVTGTIMLISAIVHNAKTSVRLRHIDDRINQLKSGNVGPATNEPPPPPPPPPSSYVPSLTPQFVLASF